MLFASSFTRASLSLGSITGIQGRWFDSTPNQIFSFSILSSLLRPLKLQSCISRYTPSFSGLAPRKSEKSSIWYSFLRTFANCSKNWSSQNVRCSFPLVQKFPEFSGRVEHSAPPTEIAHRVSISESQRGGWRQFINKIIWGVNMKNYLMALALGCGLFQAAETLASDDDQYCQCEKSESPTYSYNQTTKVCYKTFCEVRNPCVIVLPHTQATGMYVTEELPLVSEDKCNAENQSGAAFEVATCGCSTKSDEPSRSWDDTTKTCTEWKCVSGGCNPYCHGDPRNPRCEDGIGTWSTVFASTMNDCLNGANPE